MSKLGGLTISLGKPGGSTSASTAIVPVAAPINLQVGSTSASTAPRGG
jgi:hypothetical protein